MDDLSAFDYDLPKELIAQTPLKERSASRLLHLDRKTGEVLHRKFNDVACLFREGDLLVVNETRVTAIRLFGVKPSGGKFELLLLNRIGSGLYEALCRPAKKLPEGSELLMADNLRAVVTKDLGDGRKAVAFDKRPNLEEAIAEAGFAPLPPYIETELKEKERYQTVYAAKGGSAAAPTAGLHFTPEIFDALDRRGVRVAKVELQIGLDTFRPVTVEDVSLHRMQGELCSVSEETAKAVSECEGRIVAVGTTSVRTLESFAVGPRTIVPGEMVSTLFIRPPYRFQVVDGMFTNFHMPKTTMLLMISAFAGPVNISKAYEAAVANRYRFLSFGDSMLIL